MIPQMKYSNLLKVCRFCINEGHFINILDRSDLIYVYFMITNNTVSHLAIFNFKWLKL